MPNPEGRWRPQKSFPRPCCRCQSTDLAVKPILLIRTRLKVAKRSSRKALQESEGMTCSLKRTLLCPCTRTSVSDVRYEIHVARRPHPSWSGWSPSVQFAGIRHIYLPDAVSRECKFGVGLTLSGKQAFSRHVDHRRCTLAEGAEAHHGLAAPDSPLHLPLAVSTPGLLLRTAGLRGPVTTPRILEMSPRKVECCSRPWRSARKIVIGRDDAIRFRGR